MAKRPEGVKSPVRDEEDYLKDLRRYTEVEIAGPAKAAIKSDNPKAILAQLEREKKKAGKKAATMAKAVRENFEDVEALHRKRFIADLMGVMPDVAERISGETLGRWLAATTKSNVSLIRDMTEDQFGKMSKRLAAEFAEGRFDRQKIAKIAGDVLSAGDSRAKLIARDQISKATGKLTELRQVDAGIERYKWLASGDDRVREEHAANNGKKFKWDDPPGTGHPGEDINCRCRAIPIIE